MQYRGKPEEDYNWISNPPTGVVPATQVPFSKWMPDPQYTQSNQIAYMGGLAKYILENNIHSTSAHRSTPFPTLEITIDPSEDLYIDTLAPENIISAVVSHSFQLPAPASTG